MTSPPPSPAGFPEELVAAALDAARASAERSIPIFTICGLQGSGKSTLAAQMVKLAARQGLVVANVSIDDFYLTRAQRGHLAAQVHPLLATRGPPGTHDLGLAHHCLSALRDGEPVALPRFDKLADERAPQSQWPRIAKADLVIFEGWFLKTPAENDDALRAPLNALEREQDAEGRWRRWCNTALDRDYPALWQHIDALWFLQPPSFEVVAGWRWQQEQTLQAQQSSRTGMSRAGVGQFVQYFERVSRQALRALPAIADHCIPLDANRQIIAPELIPPRK